MTEGNTVTDWLIVNPKDLDRNTNEDLYPDANSNYSLWMYEITDTNEDPSPRVQLAPGDSQLINLDITLTAQVPEGIILFTFVFVRTSRINPLQDISICH